VCLLAKVVQIQLVNEPLDGELDLGTLLTGSNPVADPYELNALEAEAMVQAKQFAHVPREGRDPRPR
jgi:hypothetical protein